MDDIGSCLADLRRRITDACRRGGRRPDSVRLIAVSKTFGPDAIHAALAAGQNEFAESYLQEALLKIMALETAPRAPVWHFIGPLQSNKTRDIARHFAWVESVDRLKIAERLSAQRSETLPPLEICVQVNISGETSKAGCAPGEAAALCAAVARLPRLRLRGLMTIPEAVDNPEAARPSFHALRQLLEAIRSSGGVDPSHFDSLSMGMSGDFEVAIEEGATMVRIGTAIFGRRPP